MQDSVSFLESQLDREISDNYTLSLITYALSSVGSPRAKEALNVLTQRAEQEGNSWDPCEVGRPLCVMKYINYVRKSCKPGMDLITFAPSEPDEH